MRPWTFRAGGEITRRPVVHDGTIYAGAGDSRLYAVAADSGAGQWSAELPAAPVGSALAFDDTVCIATEDGISAFAASDGSPLWTLASGSADFAVDDRGNLLIGGMRSPLRSVDPATGRERWRHEFAETYSGPVTVSGDHVVVHEGSYGHCYCLDTGTGKMRWSTYYGTDFASFVPVTIAGDAVYVGSGVGELIAMNLSDGEIRWRQQTFRTDIAAQENPGDPVYGLPHMKFAPSAEAAPLIAGDRLYVVLRNGFLRCYTLDGLFRWSELTFPPMAPDLAVAGDLIVGLVKRNRIRAWNATTGDQEWTARVGRSSWPPVALDDAIFVACGRTIHAHSAADGKGPSRGLFGR
jgi:outer membrane protein assembly factor BamB